MMRCTASCYVAIPGCGSLCAGLAAIFLLRIRGLCDTPQVYDQLRDALGSYSKAMARTSSAPITLAGEDASNIDRCMKPAINRHPIGKPSHPSRMALSHSALQSRSCHLLLSWRSHQHITELHQKRTLQHTPEAYPSAHAYLLLRRKFQR